MILIVAVKGLGSGAVSLTIGFLLGEKVGGAEAALLAMVVGFVTYGLSIACYIRAQRTLGAAKTSAYYAASPFIGAAFSFLAGAGGWQRWFFTGIGLVAGIFIVWMLRSRPGEKLFGFAMASILGGALGNVLDRLLHGYVVDMLDFHWRWLEPLFHGGHFPAFNIADTAITIGAACLILDEILRVRRSR